MILVIDLISLVVAGSIWAALIPAAREPLQDLLGTPISLVLLALGLLLSGYICGLYTLNALRFGQRLIKASVINKTIDALIFLTFFLALWHGKIVFMIYLSWVLIFTIVWVAMRALMSSLLVHGMFQVPVGFLVDIPEASEIIENLELNPQIGFKPDFLLTSNMENGKHSKLRRIAKESEAISYIEAKGIPLVIGDRDGQPDNGIGCSDLPRSGTKLLSIISFYEFVMQKLPLDLISTSWLRENMGPTNHVAFDVVKRVFDIALSVFLLVIGLPLWPFICLAIQLESPGPVLFRQDRLGKGRQVFAIYKFRTMRVNGNNHAPAERNDARVTRVGNFLRKTRLDELPQIMNILRGEMSWIGPRPERPELAEKLADEIPFFFERNRVLPGLTGWDQICGEYHSPSYSDSYKKIQYDLYYIKNRSIALELRILLKTVRTVLFREGI